MKITLYTSPTCHKCKSIKEFLIQNNIKFEEVNAFENMDKIKEIVEKTGLMNLPLIDIDGKFFSIKNLDELKEKLSLT